MTLEGDQVVHHPINNSLESHYTDSQSNPEAQPKKKKRKRKLKDKDASIDIHEHASKLKDDSIGANSWHDFSVEISAQKEFKTAAYSVLSSNNSSLKSHNIDSQFNPEGECPQPKKKKRKRKLNDKAALIDVHGDGGTCLLKDDSVRTNSCHNSLAETNAKIDFNTASLPVPRRNNNSLDSRKIDSQCDPEVEYPQPKMKKRKRKLKDKDALTDIHGDSCMLKDDPCGANSCHDSLTEINAQIEYKTAAFPVLSLSRNNRSLKSHSVDSQLNPEPEIPQPKKKKRRIKVKDKDASIDFHRDTSMRKDGSIGTNSCHDSLAETNAEIKPKTAALPVLSGNNKCLESQNIDSHCNPEAECSQPKKRKVKRKLKDKDASVDIHGDTSKPKDDSIGKRLCHDSLVETNAEIEIKTAALLGLSRNNNSLESHNIDSQCNPEAECSELKQKKVKRKLKDKDTSIDMHGGTSTLRNNNRSESQNIDSHCNPEAECSQLKKKKVKRKLTDKDTSIDINGYKLRDDSIGRNSCHDSLAETNAEIKFKTAALPVLSRNNNSLESHDIDSLCNQEAESSKPKKKKMKKLKNKDVMVDIGGDTSMMKDDSIGTNSCHDSLAETTAEIKLKTAPLPELSRNNNGLESHNIDSHCNPEAECSQPKKKKVKRKLKDKNASVDIHGETTLKDDSIGTNSCHDSLVEAKTQIKFETAALPVLSRNNNSSDAHNIDSHCNPEAVCSQPKKKKVKRKLKDRDTSVEVHGDTSKLKDDPSGKNSCYDSLAEINAETEFKTSALSVLSSNNNWAESHDIDSQCNPEAECPQPKKKKRKKKLKGKDALIDIHGDTCKPKVDSNGINSCHDSLAEFNPHNKSDTAALLVLSSNNSTHDIDSQCNPEAECPQPKKMKKKKKLKDKLTDIHEHTSMLKDDLIGTFSCHDSFTEINAQTEFITAAPLVLSRNNNTNSTESDNIESRCDPKAECPQPKKKKRKRKLKGQDPMIDHQADTSTLKSDSVATNSHHESLVKTNAMTEFEIAAIPVLSSDEKCLAYHNIDSQCNLEAKCPQPVKKKRKRKLKDKDASIDSPVDTSKIRDDFVVINSCNDSSVEITAETDLKTAALPFLSRSKRKTLKLNSSGITDKVHVSLVDLDLTGTEENAPISEKQSDPPGSPSAGLVNEHNGGTNVVEMENDKKKRNRVKRKKQKIDTSVIFDNAHNPHADRDDLLSGKQNDQRSACVNFVNKDDKDTSISHEIENVKKKRRKDKKKLSTSVTVISDKAHVPPAELDRSDEKNALIFVKEIYQSTPGSNQGGTHILVGKENTKTTHIEEKPRSHSGKRRNSSSSKENLNTNQSGIPRELSMQENEKLEEDLATMAAEAIVSVSSSEAQNVASLDWFAKLASSAVDDPESEFGIGLSCKNEVHDDGMDYFEAMTLQLEETKAEEYSCQAMSSQVEAASSPRRGRARKGRKQRQKNFQREILPRLATLSRCEVNEDLQALGMLTEAMGRKGRTMIRRRRPS